MSEAPANLRIDVAFHGSRQTVSSLLKVAIEDESKLLLDKKSLPREFTLTLTSAMGDRRDNRKGSFIQSMDDLLKSFYGDVVQGLRAWQPSAPRLKPADDPGAEVASDSNDLIDAVVTTESPSADDETPDETRFVALTSVSGSVEDDLTNENASA